jgi:hypothetical protein
MEHREKLKEKIAPADRVSKKDSCTEPPEGANGQDSDTPKTGGTPLIEEEHPSQPQTTGHLEGLTEKVGSLSQQQSKKNRCGAARKRARRTKRPEAPTGATAEGQLQTSSGEPRILQGPSTSAAKGEGATSAEMKP